MDSLFGLLAPHKSASVDRSQKLLDNGQTGSNLEVKGDRTIRRQSVGGTSVLGVLVNVTAVAQLRAAEITGPNPHSRLLVFNSPVY